MKEFGNLIYTETDNLSIYGKVFFIIIILVLSFVILWAVKKMLFRKFKLNNKVVLAKVNTLRRISYNIIKVGVIFVAIMSVLEIIGINTNSLIATAGISGLAIGFGAQYIIRDYISGVIIMAEDQYRVGELVRISGAEGYVEDVGLRLTKLRDANGDLHIIQNGNITVVTNQSRGPKRVWSDIPVSKKIEPDRVENALVKACNIINKEIDEIVEPISFHGITNMTDFDAVYTLKGMVEPGQQLAVERKVRQKAMEELKKAGITYASLVTENKEEE